MSVSIEQSLPEARARFSAPAAVAILLVVCAAGLWPSVVSLENIWRHMGDYEHGYLVALVSLVWLHRRRDAIAQCPSQPSWLGLSALALVLLTWIIAYRSFIDVLHQGLLPLALLGTIWASAGWRMMCVTLAPISYLYFAIPVWEHIVPLLQQLATLVAEHVLSLLGVSTKVVGNDVEIPAGMFTIAEGCSGKRYLIVTLALAVICGAIHRLSIRRWGILLSFAILAALVTNWVRIITIIYLGHVTHMQHPFVAVEHNTFGTVLFLPLLAAVLFVAWWLRDRNATVSDERHTRPEPRVSWLSVPLIVIVVAVLVGSSSNAMQRSIDALPLSTGTWQGPLPALNTDWMPRFANADDERRVAYAMPELGMHVYVYVNVYGSQYPGRELVYYTNSVLPKDWAVIQVLPAGAMSDDVPKWPQRRIVRDARGGRWVVAHLYNVGGILTANPGVAQLSYGVLSLKRPTAAGIVALATTCEPDCSVATQAIDRLWYAQGMYFLTLISST